MTMNGTLVDHAGLHGSVLMLGVESFIYVSVMRTVYPQIINHVYITHSMFNIPARL